jgi:hypothetical protein
MMIRFKDVETKTWRQRRGDKDVETKTWRQRRWGQRLARQSKGEKVQQTSVETLYYDFVLQNHSLKM